MDALVLFVVVSWLGGSLGLDLPDYAECCHYCKGEEQLWSTIRPSWNLTLQDDVTNDVAKYVTSFSNPSAYLVQDELEAEITLYERDYVLHYAGAPVRIDYTDISKSAVMLNGQYLELDLGVPMDVAGVSVQGGFYEEIHDELVDKRETWMTDFLVSYSTTPTGFQYVLGDSGIEVYSADSENMDIHLADFGQVVTVQYIRVHPLGAKDKGGATSQALIRASAIICTMTTCDRPRLNCVPGDWAAWSSCQCRWDGCRQTRHRDVMRYQSCGGVACGTSTETRLCSAPAPLWKTILMWVGICLLLLTILVVAIYLAYRKYKKKEPKNAFDKDAKRKNQKKKKEARTLRDDNKNDVTEENLDRGDDDNDFAERTLAPTTSSAAAGGGAAAGGAGAGAAAAGGAAAIAGRKKQKREQEENTKNPDGLYDETKATEKAPEPAKAAPVDADPWGRSRPSRGAAAAAQKQSSDLPPIQTTSTRGGATLNDGGIKTMEPSANYRQGLLSRRKNNGMY